MRRTQKLFTLIPIMGLLASLSMAQGSIKQNKKQTVALAAASNPVTGSGTPGQITKWAGVSGSNTFTIGDSNIFEDKFGMVGIGTKTPTSLLTVQGMIETTLGGYKFPDGTVQTTAGIAFVTHDASLMGDGRSATPLGIALGGVQTIHLANGAVTAPKIANGTVVRSLNGLFDNVSLAAGSNITITPSGNTLTIASPNSLTSVAHGPTLTGSGTVASPLGVAVPLGLDGSFAFSVFSATNSGGGIGVRGQSTSSIGVRGESDSGEGVSGFSTLGDGVRGEGLTGVNGKGNDNPNSTGFGGNGLLGKGGNSNGPLGGFGVRGEGGANGSVGNFGAGGNGVFGLGGDSNDFVAGDGVSAQGGNSNTLHGGGGVSAQGGSSFIAGSGGLGVQGQGGTGTGVGNAGGTGIFGGGGNGVNGAAAGLAGAFLGDVDVQGKLTKTMGTFKIDHPLDPENKYLYHSFVESPDMMNIYNGNITTDPNGEAVVEMPAYFDALNKDFRYQLTVIGTFAQAIVAIKMKSNRFVIKTSAPNVEVSWMVTGVRQDAYADKNRVQVEVDKPEKERGYYLHPDVFNQPEEKSVEWVRHPEMMQKLKQQRLEAEQKIMKQQQR